MKATRSATPVIFDMDGVLVASGPAHHASWKAVARKHALDVSAETFTATFGRTSRDIIRLLWNRPLRDDEVAAIDAEKERIYRELISGMVPLTIGVREMLSDLAATGCPLAVATSGPPENVALVLSEGRLQSFFRVVVTGADILNGKPAPDCFLLAAERLGVAAADCVVIEDAPSGVMAAKAAGMTAVGYTSGHSATALRAAGADQIVAALREITPAAVAQWAAKSC